MKRRRALGFIPKGQQGSWLPPLEERPLKQTEGHCCGMIVRPVAESPGFMTLSTVMPYS